ncbi:16S rRNA pseudouridine516 synthase [Enterococcus sp. AZ135]|uniref:16S rRNA pseudouridine(516) synthase n=1 Tax=unclassified Enterococcus TaxID=2608891 RepID=UPI003F236123
MRLDKVIEQNLRTTRKEMKRLFLMKKVRIDDIVEMNQQRNVDSNLHNIQVDGQIVQTNHVYYLLNKPAGVVTAKKDLKFKTATELVAEAERPAELYPVGRLDRDTTGLLLLTDNGQLGYDLLQPRAEVSKKYYAVVNEAVTMDDVAAFKEGITFHGGVRCQSAQLEILSSEAENSEVLLTIKEGKFHQVKKMFLACGKKVTKLTRLTMGPLVLPEDLTAGAYRSLTITELQQLKKYFR